MNDKNRSVSCSLFVIIRNLSRLCFITTTWSLFILWCIRTPVLKSLDKHRSEDFTICGPEFGNNYSLVQNKILWGNHITNNETLFRQNNIYITTILETYKVYKCIYILSRILGYGISAAAITWPPKIQFV